MRPYNRWHCFLVILFFPFNLIASPQCTSWLAKVVSSQGIVDYQPFEYSKWHMVVKDNTFCYGDKVRTAKNSRATLMLSNGSIVTLDQNTTLVFLEPEHEHSNWLLKLFSGSVFFRSRLPQKLNIQTPFINAVHEGTEFLVAVDSLQTTISVFDGIVAAENEAVRIRIRKGFTGIAAKDRPPEVSPLRIHPEDAVQWTLYYPAVVDYRVWDTADTLDLQPVLDAYGKGDIDSAIKSLDTVSIGRQSSRYLILKASLLLAVGRVDEASQVIARVLRQQPDNGNAYALQAIIAVTKNRQDKAFSLAEKAVELDPQSSAAWLALSFAHQSRHQIEQALQAAQKAVTITPDNAVAWARLSELQLSLGDHDSAMVSAQKARLLNPDLARIQTILGFAGLARIDIDMAKSAFERAVDLDAGDPIARLGLGLAKIRKGAIEEGRRDLEIAVSLDPNNAVARSYLGKSYYELKNVDYAGTEFAIAKEMDAKDPTPWFYDAILKQSENRPVEALHDMQKAIVLNDNRGVYRSQLLLDEDAAARTANLARIYNDLGFGRVALNQAWKSLGYDSTNHSAHRFLADAYIGQPRFRIARASELLQAQLLQPVNITPVQPQLTSENIGILNNLGPSSLSENEYDPMFTSNGAHVLLNGAVGSNNTLTDNAIVSGVYDQLSMSFGQFHFQTDGFRKNDAYQQDVYDAFAQYSFNQDLSIQFEFKSEDVRAGDVPFRLNGFHQENLKNTTEHDTARVGGHYRIDARQDLIVSAYYTTRKDIIRNHSLVDILSSDTLLEFKDKGYQAEMQYLFHDAIIDLKMGLGYLNLTTDESIKNSLHSIVPTLSFNNTDFSANQRETDYFNAYLYSNLNLWPTLTTTFGLSLDSYHDDSINRIRLNPKFGAIWSPIKDLTVRGAVLRTMKRPLAASQTIEPTQVAGFNQFFDGTNATLAWQYSLGFDYALFDKVFVGGQVNWRDTREPFASGAMKQRRKDETSYLAYFYWTPTEWLALRSEYRYDEYDKDFIVNNADPSDPQNVITQQVPISLSLFGRSGLFAKLTGTYVDQDVTSLVDLAEKPIGSEPLQSEHEDFWSFDASVGYRLPKKIGIASVEVNNIFDNEFGYQSIFDASGPQMTPFIPERQIFFKLSLFY